MVCRAGQTCQIQFNLFHGAKDKILPTDRLPLRESTRGKDLYDYIEEHCQIQPDSFKLYLLSTGKLIDLSEMKEKTMSEAGVDFSFDRESLTEHKHTLLVVGPTDTLSEKQVEYGLSTYNPPPPSPNHSSVWNEDNADFKNRIKSEARYVGLVNQAMTCYLNSLLQALYMTPEFRNALYNWEYIDRSEKDETSSIPFQLQKLFLNLQTSTKSAVETTALTKSFGWDSTEAWQQHDIQELCRVMFDALEQKFKNTEQADLINRLYEGKMTDYVKCLECGTEKSREDTFLDIPLPVRPFGSSVAYNSVEEALIAFVQYETLEGSNQYHCEKCNKKCDAHKGLKFTKFPYLLTLHLKRFDFDFKTFHRIKLNDKVTFPDVLNLNSFVYSTEDEETQNGDETMDSPKCNANSVTDSGINDDCPLYENSLPNNSNHTNNHDQDDDEGIETSNGPSTSNCIERNDENEKKSNSNVVKGPYNYELFSIMIHSGSASGGHYYAYIKDFRTQEWLCFNDQTVTQITHDDIQKTYGGGLSRSYFSGYSSTNAYMLMYRQIDPVRNALPMQVQDFPKHIQELLKRVKEKEENDKKMKERERQAERVDCGRIIVDEFYSESTYIQHKVMVYYIPPGEDKLQFRVPFTPDSTLAEITEQVYKIFSMYDKDGMVSLSQCRIVAYDAYNDAIVNTFEGRERETFRSIWGNKRTGHSLLLDIQHKDKKFETYQQSDIITKVSVIDIRRKRLLQGPLIVRSFRTETVRGYTQVLSKLINIEPEQINIAIQKCVPDVTFLKIDDTELQAAGFCNLVTVFVYTVNDTGYKPSLAAISEIAKELDNIIMISIMLPPSISKEVLEELNIPTNEEKYKEKEKLVPVLTASSATDSPSKTSVNESQRDSNGKCNDVSKSEKSNEDTSARNASPQLGEGEEWHTPEQSNSEDSSLSDSDKTLVGDAPDEDDGFQLPYLPSSTSNRVIKMLNQVGLENWENIIDDSEYYFKATPYKSQNENFLEVMVDHRIMFSTLKKNLEPYIGVPSEHFRIYRHFDVCDESEDTSLSAQFAPYEDSQKLWIQIGSSLRNREFPVKLYQFFLDSTEFYKYLFEWTISKDMTVGQAKEEILAEMKKKYNIDIPYERCRLRKKSFVLAKKVFLDHQKFEDIHFHSNFEMIVQELPDKDPVINSNQVIVFVRRLYPDKTQLGPLQEIVLDEKTVEDVLKKLSLITDIPEEHIAIAKISGLIYSMSTVPVYKNIDWNVLTVGVDLDVLEGDLFLYRDGRRVTSKQTRKDISEIKRNVSRYFPAPDGTRYSARKEKALRIFLDDE